MHSLVHGVRRLTPCPLPLARGVFKYSNGDRYEGEFEDNQMSGYGVYVWGQEGSVYRGQVRLRGGKGWGCMPLLLQLLRTLAAICPCAVLYLRGSPEAVNP